MLRFIKKHSTLFSGLFSLASVYALVHAGLRLDTRFGETSTASGVVVVSHSVVSLLLFLFCWLAIRKAIPLLNKRLALFSGALGLLFSAMLVIGAQVFVTDHAEMASAETWLGILGVELLFTSLAALLLEGLPRWQARMAGLYQNKPWARFFCGDARYFLVLWALFVIGYFPAFLAAYPGIYAYDSIYQVRHVMVGGAPYASNPVLHTLYLYGSLQLGQAIFGSYSAGIAFYAITQMLIMAAIFAYACGFVARRGASVPVQVGMILFFLLVPIHGMLAVSSTKDVLHAGFMLLLVLCTVDMTTRQEAFFSSPWRVLRFVGIAFLTCAFRNNGNLILVLSTPLLMWVMKGRRLKTLGMMCVVLALWMVFTGPIYQVFRIHTGAVHESLSVPIQQLARVVVQARDQISQEDYQEICEIIPEERFKQYRSRTSDLVKNYFRDSVFLENPEKYGSLWLRMGLQWPGIYLDSFLANNFGFWYPDMAFPDPPVWHPYLMFKNSDDEGDYLLIPNEPISKGLNTFYNRIAYDTAHQQFPALSMFMSPGFAAWMLFFLTGAFVYYKKRRMLAPHCYLLLYFGGLLLSPVVLVRYAYPIFVALPVLCGLLFTEPLGEADGIPCPEETK